MNRHLLFCLLFLPLFVNAQDHSHSHSQGRKIIFPDIPGYRTLKCDFHIHTVFSDGSVWPDIRIEEALRDGLDAVSMTEHLEYQPHKADIPHPDRNRSHDLALKSAAESGLIVVRGSEITRSMPPGHSNAIFIQDANKLLLDDPVEVFREAKRQGAFIFWNHPNWIAQRSDGVAVFEEMHRQLVAEGLLDGIEVVNDLTYSDEALQLALDNDLTIMGTSDIHGLVDWQFDLAGGGHRAISLVFATEKSEAAIKTALEEGRTVAWFNNLLVGKDEYLVPLVEASLSIDSLGYQPVRGGQSTVLSLLIRNSSDADYILMNRSSYSLHANSDVVHVPHHSTTLLQVKTLKTLNEIDLQFEVLNAITAPRTHPEIHLRAAIPQE